VVHITIWYTNPFWYEETHIEYLVGGFNYLEKYEFVNGKDDIPYMKWKINKIHV